MNTNPDAKRILCYGDSYTWGYVPLTDHKRMPSDVRWTGVLQNLLGKDYEIIEEGLNSRTLVSDDNRPNKQGRSGTDYLIPCLDSHDPIDLVIVMLGTNESKTCFSITIEEIKEFFEEHYIKTILGRKSQFQDTFPKLLLLSPPLINESTEYASKRYVGSKQKLIQLTSVLRDLSQQYGCYFLDAGSFLCVGDDGVHIDAENHQKLAKHLAEIVVTIL